MPSGNIFCTDDGHEALMTCLIKNVDVVPPGRPASCLPSAWGHYLMFDESHLPLSVQFECGAVPQYPTGYPTLQYGQTNDGPAADCTSATGGLTCIIGGGDHAGYGFRLNKAGLTVLPGIATNVDRVSPIFQDLSLRPGYTISADAPWQQCASSVSPGFPPVRSQYGGTAYQVSCVDGQFKPYRFPCWPTADPSSSLLCLTSYDSHVVHRLTVSRPLPVLTDAGYSAADMGAWEIVLADGTHCTSRSGGATTLPWTYLCGPQDVEESGLVGPITKSGDSWSALYINPSQVKAFTDSGRTLPTPTPARVHIAFAYFNG